MRERGAYLTVNRLVGQLAGSLCIELYHVKEVLHPYFRVRWVLAAAVEQDGKAHLKRLIVLVDVVGEVLLERAYARKAVFTQVEVIAGQRPRSSAVPIFEWVDRRKLVVDDAGLHEGMVIECFRIGEQFIKQGGHPRGLGRNAVGLSGRTVVDGEQHARRHRAAQPYLLGTRSSDDYLLNLQEQILREGLGLIQTVLQKLEGGVIVQHLLRFEKKAMLVFDGPGNLLLGVRISLDLGGGMGGFLPGILAHAVGYARRDALPLESVSALLDGEDAVEHRGRQ